ncbi:MAG: peptidoglycan DD-metalloendopeptidase family protein [Rhodobacteraceae bacterium]|jgi:murein DD-endopeptidase MepM/ murein hydrolase activator NlpD|nr:peptidoglycan DD-metalloendopeptidase family protein [Paracoccaceae bacterium]
MAGVSHDRRKAAGRTATGLAALAALAVAGCTQPIGSFDPDLRRLGSGFNTADAAANIQTEARPQADGRGILSYPGYQVAVARDGDTVADIASRVGLSADELARHNGLPLDATLRSGEIVALPRRVGEPSPATGAITSGPIMPGSVDITTLAGGAIERAGSGRTTPVPAAGGTQPVQHQVTRGETAFTIARSYGVSVEALAQWNGLDSQFSVREGQFLLIPPVMATARTAAAAPPVEPPGAGSATPPPPSSATPLPPPPTAAPPVAAAPPPPTTAATRAAQFAMPVQGPIIRAFARGRNDGIDIGAPAGTPVRAAEAGTVAAITQNTDGVPIVVIRHPNDLLTVYAGLDNVTVSRGTAVTRGQQIATVRTAQTPFLHFEVRRGMEALDPGPFLE